MIRTRRFKSAWNVALTLGVLACGRMQGYVPPQNQEPATANWPSPRRMHVVLPDDLKAMLFPTIVEPNVSAGQEPLTR